ncbi:Down syndrome cell adhesion molecule-like protein 1 homolog isoform X2 [Trematomus bernacchii]|uniref:Down syndrome cell adhesion molecule-like protein 1 homolog isoform X2 n=1 Tax=Trematomus bernacchii TaxID=40690 RepID=UPI00146C4F2A|nr:Down syndrome cell adhesion molecule-like protein 1 homolog isoform X2 [Trematomus bernacchii]
MFSLGRSLLFCLLLGCVSAESIIVTVGEDVTLICNYDAKYYGKLPACWGRGSIPNRGCDNEVIKADGTTVTSRLSERYLLKGDIGEGDVSLTIRKVEEGDSGMYGCRVQIPGWFNDHKHQLTLTVVAVRPNAPEIEIRELKPRTVTVRWSLVFDGGKPIEYYLIDLYIIELSSRQTSKVYNPQLTQLTLELRPAKAYDLRMFAINSVGRSDTSNVLTFTTKEAAPEGPPLDMQLEPLSSHTIKVTWKPPRTELRNGVLRSYSISYREYDPAGRQFKKWQHLSVPATRDLESIVLSNLKPSARYGVIIQAKTDAGIGPASNAPLCSTLDEVHKSSTVSNIKSSSTAATWITVQSVPAATVWGGSTPGITSVPPDPPVLELKEVRDNTFSILWTPGFEGDTPITGYYLESKSANASWDYIKTVIDFSPNQTDATIIEMNPSTFNIRMFAKNSLATSGASNVLTITTGEGGHQRGDVLTTISTDTHAAASVDKSQSGHLAAIAVPVVLVLLVVGMVTTWKLLRIKLKKGNLNMWLTNGALRYRGAEPLQEL